MKSPFRFLIYLVIGFLIYQLIESGATSFTYEQTRQSLVIGIIVVFILMLIVRVIKNRYDRDQ